MKTKIYENGANYKAMKNSSPENGGSKRTFSEDVDKH